MEPPDLDINPSMTFEQFVAELPQHPSSLRHGQWCFTLLWENDPELADRIRGTDLDPSYWPDADYLTSQKWQALMIFLAHNWSGDLT